MKTKSLLALFFRPKWEVRRTIWPYKEGYGTYCPSKRMVLDTGLTRDEAIRKCDELNKSEK